MKIVKKNDKRFQVQIFIPNWAEERMRDEKEMASSIKQLEECLRYINEMASRLSPIRFWKNVFRMKKIWYIKL